MSDIARLAGVSKSTVSRALADSPLVSDKTKKLVREIAGQHNYRVNASARNFRLKESLTAAMLIPAAEGVDWTISDPFFLEMTAAVAEALDERGHSLLVSKTSPQPSDFLENFVAQRKADGLILLGQGTQHEVIQRIATTYRGISVWGEAVPGAKYPTVGSDNALGGRRAVDHLLARGCRRIAFVGHGTGPEIDARLDGYRAALGAAGVAIDESLIFGAIIGTEESKSTIEKVVSLRRQIDGIFVATDMQAVALMTALMQAGVSIPDDCAVVGYDDLSFAEQYHPALTTVHQSLTLGARVLVDNLLAGIEGRDTASVRLDPQLIIRESA